MFLTLESNSVKKPQFPSLQNETDCIKVYLNTKPEYRNQSLVLYFVYILDVVRIGLSPKKVVASKNTYFHTCIKINTSYINNIVLIFGVFFFLINRYSTVLQQKVIQVL